MEIKRSCENCKKERTVDDEIGHWVCPECGYWNEIDFERN